MSAHQGPTEPPLKVAVEFVRNFFQEKASAKGLTLSGRTHTESQSPSLPPPQEEWIVLKPRDFFLAFGGVICVVFEGFPLPLEALKKELNQAMVGMHKENLGSKWAKVSLGGPQHPSGHTFSLEEVKAVRELCLAFRHKLRDTSVKVHHLSLVEFTNRSLERRTQTVPISVLACCDPPPHQTQQGVSDTTAAVTASWYSAVSGEMRLKTDTVVAEFFGSDTNTTADPQNVEGEEESQRQKAQFEEYAEALAHSPSSAAMYRSHHHGATLACDILAQGQCVAVDSSTGILANRADDNTSSLSTGASSSPNVAFLDVVLAFEQAVNEALRQKFGDENNGEVSVLQFEWFDVSALHATVRGVA